MDNKSDVVIIGGVAAGPKTGATLARRRPDLKITLFQKEEHLSYGTCGMPYFASGDINSFDDLLITSYDIPRNAEFFRKSKGFEAVTGTEVIALNRERKSVTVKTLATGETREHGYKKLILATGSNPVPSPFPVPDSPKVRPFTRPDDAIKFRQLAQTGQVGKVVIVGGGFIGCEMAEACTALWGMETVLVEKETQLLPYVLDTEMSRLVEREMLRNDIKLHLGETVEKIELNPDDNPVVTLAGGDKIAADFVFLCLGVRPEVTLAREAGLELGETGGILVDLTMQTSDPDIYAGGDCVESLNLISHKRFYIPMGSLANRHGRVIAENIAGRETEFKGAVGAFMIKAFDLNIGSVGLSERAAEKADLTARAVWASFPDKPDYYPESKTFTLKMIYDPESGRLLGLQAVGGGDICRRIDVFSSYLLREAAVDDLLDFEPGYAPPYAEAIDPLHHLAGIADAVRRGIDFVCPGTDGYDDDNITWLDVREPDEQETHPWPCGNHQKLVKITLNDLRDHLDELDKKAQIMIVCRRGPRSYQSAIILKDAGFEKVSIISGGTQASL